MNNFNQKQVYVIQQLLSELIHQENAQIIIPAHKPEPGYWFGGGKMALDTDGTIWLSGRFRNAGDSRTGLEAGVRGAECAIFRSEDGGTSFRRTTCWTKVDFSSSNRDVISIEGTALHKCMDNKWELYISTEKAIPYPEAVRHYQKSGTGVWSIDRITGRTPESLDEGTLEPILENLGDPAYLHVKDPVVFNRPDGNTALVFCTHPYCWTSDNSGYAIRKDEASPFEVQSWEMVPRGATWDVAVTRITSQLPIPKLGSFKESEQAVVYFYDGAECMRSHQENTQALKRPRGYSCEEIGGAFLGRVKSFPSMERLSKWEPLFTSPWGTGSCRYIDCLATRDGILATWQQSQPDGSQPLVRNFLAMDEVERILT